MLLIFHEPAGQVYFGEEVLRIFLAKLWLSSLILMATEGWGEKEICTLGVSNSKKNEERGGVGEWIFLPLLIPSPHGWL